jgi:hypothetical protein
MQRSPANGPKRSSTAAARCCRSAWRRRARTRSSCSASWARPAAAPDHRDLRALALRASFREARPAGLAEAFAAALRERDGAAYPRQLAQAREKAFRSPLLLLAMAHGAAGDAEIPGEPALVSAGCAIQNMLLMATALGFGSSLTSGKAWTSRAAAACSAGRRGSGAVLREHRHHRRSRSAPRAAGADRYVSELTPMSSPIRLSSLAPRPAASFEQPFEMLEACHERVQRMLALLARLREHLRSHGATRRRSRPRAT